MQLRVNIDRGTDGHCAADHYGHDHGYGQSGHQRRVYIYLEIKHTDRKRHC
jgi:hypothetical protein